MASLDGASFLNIAGFTHSGLFAIAAQGALVNCTSLMLFGKTKLTLMLLFKNICGIAFGLQIMILYIVDRTSSVKTDVSNLAQVVPYILCLECVSLYPYFRYYGAMPLKLRAFGKFGYPFSLLSMMVFYTAFFVGIPVQIGLLAILVGAIYPTIVTNYTSYRVIKTIANNPLSKKDQKQQGIKHVSNSIFLFGNLFQGVFIALNIIPVKDIYVSSVMANVCVGFLFDLSELLLQINRKVEQHIEPLKSVVF